MKGQQKRMRKEYREKEEFECDFRHPDIKVLTEPFRYTERYSCSYVKVSEFHLAAIVEFYYCI
jgi:hypothetical protein